MKKIFSLFLILTLLGSTTVTLADFSSQKEESVFFQVVDLLEDDQRSEFLNEYNTLKDEVKNGNITEASARQEWQELRTKVIGVYRVSLVRQAKQSTEMAANLSGKKNTYARQLKNISDLLDEAEKDFLQEYFWSAEQNLSGARQGLKDINSALQSSFQK